MNTFPITVVVPVPLCQRKDNEVDLWANLTFSFSLRLKQFSPLEFSFFIRAKVRRRIISGAALKLRPDGGQFKSLFFSVSLYVENGVLIYNRLGVVSRAMAKS